MHKNAIKKITELILYWIEEDRKYEKNEKS
jgi:hypothetical protein